MSHNFISNNIRDRHLPIADKRSEKKSGKVEYYAHLYRIYGIFPSQSDVRGGRAAFNRSAIRKKRERSIINEKDYGCNDLHLAITNNKIDNVKKLIDTNEEYVKGQDHYGNTPLHFAVQKNDLEIFQVLMDHIAKDQKKSYIIVKKNDDGETPLHLAARRSNVKVVEKLLEYVNDKEGYVKHENSHKETPLFFTVRKGSKLQVFKKLIECFTEANEREEYVKSQNKLNLTPLHFAARSGNIAVISKLLEFVDAETREDYVKSKNNKGATPIELALKNKKFGVAQYLEVNRCLDHNGGTILHVLARLGCIDAISDLLGEGADINAVDKNGFTPLC